MAVPAQQHDVDGGSPALADQRHAQRTWARVLRLAGERVAGLGLPGARRLRCSAGCAVVPRTVALSHASRQHLCPAGATVPAAIPCEQCLGHRLGGGDPSSATSPRCHAVGRRDARRDDTRARPCTRPGTDTCASPSPGPRRLSPTAAGPYAHDRVPRVCHPSRRCRGPAVAGTSSRREAPEGTHPDHRVRGVRDSLLRYRPRAAVGNSTTTPRLACRYATCDCAPRLSSESSARVPDCVQDPVSQLETRPLRIRRVGKAQACHPEAVHR